jgi:formylglycine-generating enzyme required for sulfatase activity
MALSRAEIDERCRRIDEAPFDDFARLVELAGLDKTRNLRCADWSDVSFRNSDIRGFDFTAARLHNCDFTGAKIAGACFVRAELGAVLPRGNDNPNAPARTTGIANLYAAADWKQYLASFADPKRWKSPAGRYDAGHLPVGAIFSDAPGVAPEMIVIAAGDFLMGSAESDARLENFDDVAWDNEIEKGHGKCQMRITRRFALGRYPVTFDEYDAFLAATKKKRRRDGDEAVDPRKWGRGRRPVINVSWDDAQAYCRWLNRMTGLHGDFGYRLPSEAEWEYACRAGTQTRRWWADSWDPTKANGARSFENGRTSPVGHYAANPWGLHDMIGNVWEWCADRYAAPYEGADKFRKSSRVLRGGCWLDAPRILRSADRGREPPEYRDYYVGFRVAKTL